MTDQKGDETSHPQNEQSLHTMELPHEQGVYQFLLQSLVSQSFDQSNRIQYDHSPHTIQLVHFQ